MRFAVTLGRFLLGLYFFLPGISKVTGYADTLTYMALHNIPAPDLLLPITIVLQIGGGGNVDDWDARQPGGFHVRGHDLDY